MQSTIGALLFLLGIGGIAYLATQGAVSAAIVGADPLADPSIDAPPVLPVASSSDADTLARTIFGEARGEGQEGWNAVAAVVMNRFHLGPIYGYPITVAGVCRQANQFSCWNANDPNFTTIQDVTTADPIFAAISQVADQAVAGALADPTGGAEFYHDTSIATPASWVRAGYVETVQIGHLIFFKRG